MRETGRTRLATAEVHWGRDPGSILWIGNRAVHQYWALLGPYFRDILLAPQRRTEDEIVGWTWREGAESRMPTGAELAALRKRLAGDQRAFAENARDSATGERGATGLKTQANVAQLAAAMEGLVARLLAMPDAELAAFVACTESGLRLHSWGVAKAAVPFFPESRKRATGGAASEPGEPTPTAEAVAVPAERRRRRRMAVAIFAALALGGAGWGGWQWWAAVRESEQRTVAGANASERAAKDFTPGKPPERFGAADGRTPERERANEAAATASAGGIGFGRSASLPERDVARPDTRDAMTKTVVKARESGAPSAVESQAASSAGAPGSSGAASATAPAGAAVGANAATMGASAAMSGSPGAAAAGGAATASQAGAGAGAPMQTAEVVPPMPPPVAPVAKRPPPRDVPAEDRAPPPASSAAPERSKPAATERATETEKVETEEARAAAEAGDGSAAAKPGAAASRAEVARARAEARAEEAQRRTRVADNRKPRTAVARDDLPTPEPGGVGTILPGEPGTSAAGATAAAWEQTVRAKATEWRVRLLTDAILPTEPVRVGAESALEALRASLLAERRAQMPAAFSAVRGRRGFAVESAVGRGLRWRLPAEAVSVATSAAGGRAEFSWTDGQTPARGVYELADESGRGVARLEVDASGETTVRLARGVHGWFWFAVDGAAAPFVWRRLSDATRPSSWRQSADARGARLDVPLAAPAGTTTVETIALFDPATGWALASRVTLAAP